MQNKGLVLSLADVQALRQAGFTPKGTLVEGTPQSFAEGGYASPLAGLLRAKTQRRSDDDEDQRLSPEVFNAIKQNRDEAARLMMEQQKQSQRTVAPGTLSFAGPTGSKAARDSFMQGGGAGTGTTPYTGPMSGGPMSDNPTAQQPTLDQLGPGQELVVGPDGWYVKNTNNTQQQQVPVQESTIRERLLGTTGAQSFANTQQTLLDNAQALQGQANAPAPSPTAGVPTPPPMRAAPLQGAQQPAPDPTAGAPTPTPAPEPTPAAPEPAAPAPEPTPTPTPAAPTPAPAPVTQAPSAVMGEAGASQAQVSQAVTPEAPELATAEAVLSSDNVQAYLDEVRAVQGEVAANNLVTAATQDPNALAQLQMDAAQIAQAQTVADVGRREVQEGEMISGPAVEQERVEELVSSIKAETAQPSELATVQGQLAKLTADFDAKNPPAWAAGALRNATAQLAARGLAASSMAGQALIQATFEAATPIAAADAATVAQFEQQNLSNRQQATLLAAQQRAEFLGQEFDQAFQTKVTNAARIAEIANMNFNADVQIALENARMAQSVDIANLNASNAKILADAAAMSNMELANLNNRQQAGVANAKAFLDINMANLNNAQQTNIFKAQSAVQSMLSDQAAANAAVNLNTTNENQLNQFFAQIEANAAQFNAAQANAIAQSNVSELNAMVKFKEEQENVVKIAYDKNQTAISAARISADASVRSSELSASASRAAAEASAAATRAAAAQRAAADQAIAAAANEARITMQEMEQQYQRESDIMAMTYDTMTSQSDKAFELVKMDLQGQIELEAAQFQMDAAGDASLKDSLVNIALGVGGKVLGIG